MSLAGGNPLATFEFGVGSHARILFERTIGEKEPGVKPARSKRRRDPAADESEIPRVKMQAIMPQQPWPRHSFRFKVVKQRSQLAGGQGPGSPREQYSDFFKQLTRRATDHGRAFLIAAVLNLHFAIACFPLPAGKRLEAAEKGEFRAALHQIHFRIVWIGIRPKENDGAGVFG